jgi:hypothetical protein
MTRTSWSRSTDDCRQLSPNALKSLEVEEIEEVTAGTVLGRRDADRREPGGGVTVPRAA